MTRCPHCKRFLPEFPGTRAPEDTFPVSHACFSYVDGRKRTAVVPFVAPATDQDRVNASHADWDLR